MQGKPTPLPDLITELRNTIFDFPEIEPGTERQHFFRTLRAKACDEAAARLASYEAALREIAEKDTTRTRPILEITPERGCDNGPFEETVTYGTCAEIARKALEAP